MPPKKKKGGQQKGSKKAKAAVQKQKKVLEDKTFGMKNKKGRKAQQQIQRLNKSVQGSKQAKQLQQQRDAAKARKLAAKKEAEERRLLMLRQTVGGRKLQAKEQAKAAGAPSITAFLNSNKEATKASMSKLDDQIAAALDPFSVTDPVEDILDKARQRLKVGGRKVTADTFKQWKMKVQKQEEMEKIKKQKERAKLLQTGKIKMTGRELFENKQELFADDDDVGGDVLDMSEFKQDDEDDQIGDPLDQVPVEILQRILEDVDTSLFDIQDPILNYEIKEGA